ncbi:hypothetical protein K443DRAFT_681845 [Laccaria amethystina LaAM-08-1]|uniref:Unplaced genomic scaffold K443scaffold_169, whole genome shotgun sequence n=1 Tax=Laccaria amethystina LaAM-08-1 TaxID=1095629 RepID=A0A0C9WWP2_9AGAR|nr:hypothetical protein K443DRAFT_681845 [Laccaria amethystina LaAM-08-1]
MASIILCTPLNPFPHNPQKPRLGIQLDHLYPLLLRAFKVSMSFSEIVIEPNLDTNFDSSDPRAVGAHRGRRGG